MAVRLAMKDAGIEAKDIDYVNAHGTSTQLNDAGETKALKIALGEHAHKVAISSTKSMIGHLLGAAGAVEAIATLLTINRGIIHPTINYENADQACDLDYVPNQARRKDVRIAISNAFGFGGHNAVVVLGRDQEEQRFGRPIPKHPHRPQPPGGEADLPPGGRHARHHPPRPAPRAGRHE